MSLRRRWPLNLLTLLAVVLSGWVYLPAQGTRHIVGSTASSSPPSSTKQPVETKENPAKSRKAKRRARPTSYRQRIANLRPHPDRIREIQQALKGAGYLQQEPNGTWDAATREAMRRYQQDHGFPLTGLPEAKTLMKLGLGPHPLPEDVDPGVNARARTVPNLKVQPPGHTGGSPAAPQNQ